MWVRYVCRHCGKQMSKLHMLRLDEVRLGLTTLTPEERAEMVFTDAATGNVTIHSFCDDCVADGDAPGATAAATGIIH